ncbi:MAG: hypothetical protein E6Q51_01365 [Methylophilus methylotrophus]|uniref:SAF domain-containing protein n=1 Tax=Methylophilus methylotrophus TaxID=17 RepID=A0A5C7WLU8_METME|nr:MAG: hypothetical protein E6Q51_01365 [Methylophilus methylotrophus]
MAQQNRKVGNSRLIVVVLIIVLLIGMLGYMLMGGKKSAERTENQAPSGRVALPLASKDINLGERISPSHFRMSYRDPNSIPEDAILRQDLIVGRYATEPIAAATYFSDNNISEPNVRGGYSAVTKPGKRVVVLDATVLPGTIGTLKVGDHIDLLAIGTSSTSSGGSAPKSAYQSKLESSPVSIEGGGINPGDPKARARQPKGKGAAPVIGATTASLVAENAVVLKVPNRGRDRETVVLEMAPQDAHVTILMVSAGATMRAVFRPSLDETRLTKETDIKITTRLPKPEPDPDRINIITGTVRRGSRADSRIYAEGNENSNPEKPDPLRNERYSDSSESNARNVLVIPQPEPTIYQ